MGIRLIIPIYFILRYVSLSMSFISLSSAVLTISYYNYVLLRNELRKDAKLCDNIYGTIFDSCPSEIKPSVVSSALVTILQGRYPLLVLIAAANYFLHFLLDSIVSNPIEKPQRFHD
jgi:hypothetical protein